MKPYHIAITIGMLLSVATFNSCSKDNVKLPPDTGSNGPAAAFTVNLTASHWTDNGRGLYSVTFPE